MNLILFTLSTIGLTHLLIEGSVFNRPRDWIKSRHPLLEELLSCFQCLGTWVGFFVGWSLGADTWLLVFLCGCAGSFLSNLSSFIHSWISANTPLGEIEYPDIDSNLDDNDV